jgi:hypothetical protein
MALEPRGSAGQREAPAPVQPASDPPAQLWEVLRREYEITGSPVEVSFRELFPLGSSKRRLTHDLHAYPGRILPSIPAFVLSLPICQPGCRVLDPFCGSGSIPLEVTLSGRDALAADTNPLARLITSSKVDPPSSEALRRARDYVASRKTAVASARKLDLLNSSLWFTPRIEIGLACLLDAIDEAGDEVVRPFLRAIFSSCVKDLSRANPRLSVPVRQRRDQYPVGHVLNARLNRRLDLLETVDVRSFFLARLNRAIERVESLRKLNGRGSLVGMYDDARSLDLLDDGAVDVVLTSPPYPGAQKYIRASSLSLTWLGLCSPKALRSLEDLNIGREHFRKHDLQAAPVIGLPGADEVLLEVARENPVRSHIAAQYLREMELALQETARVLRPEGWCVLVVGPSTIRGRRFDTPDLLAQLAVRCGLRLELALVDRIRSRTLLTKRNHAGGPIKSETVLFLEKPGGIGGYRYRA